MSPEEFAKLFKEAFDLGLLKLTVEKDSYLGDDSLTVAITDKDGKAIATETTSI